MKSEQVEQEIDEVRTRVMGLNAGEETESLLQVIDVLDNLLALILSESRRLANYIAEAGSRR